MRCWSRWASSTAPSEQAKVGSSNFCAVTAMTQLTPESLYKEIPVTTVIAVTNRRKGGEQMRSKNYGINVRVTEQEKQNMLENARFCSLSLSEYLRRLGLGKEVRAAITERDYRLFQMLDGLKAELPQLQKEEILSRLEAFLNELK